MEDATANAEDCTEGRETRLAPTSSRPFAPIFILADGRATAVTVYAATAIEMGTRID